ncbi:haloalkane dehalogenase [Mycobacterium sp. 852002-51961_SCH5331710]|uniref:haloalkane dehalogenase n=1 Tax=Mycobacterium sp. 852002-51961_SCH5331710 TaxID=1834105 RepID=UPI0007FD1ABA|nr:haloalkane dehalogenase [Mycobacterium sp. 852002-51961_SCH5331710]OBB47612.1 haloalkane dehalogenase [Mycobacterium sp. 852002-51961_SCH5331710]
MPGVKPYGHLQYKEINGKRMAYIDEGQGDAIVFQHGNPSSSYLWRNVMPHLEGLGRLVACDLIGMGGSDKLDDPGPDSYHYRENRDYLFALWDALELGDRVTLVLHDWGGALGFDWANQHRDRVAALVHMETVSVPMEWDDFPEEVAKMFRVFRSPEGEEMVLNNNVFIEGVLPSIVLRALTDEEMSYYRQPFVNPGEDRRPTLSWPRDVPLAGEPAEVVEIIEAFDAWLATSDVPKLFVRADPGVIQSKQRILDIVRSWPNQTEITVPGTHFLQEDSADEIGRAIASFIHTVRADNSQR